MSSPPSGVLHVVFEVVARRLDAGQPVDPNFVHRLYFPLESPSKPVMAEQAFMWWSRIFHRSERIFPLTYGQVSEVENVRSLMGLLRRMDNIEDPERLDVLSCLGNLALHPHLSLLLVQECKVWERLVATLGAWFAPAYFTEKGLIAMELLLYFAKNLRYHSPNVPARESTTEKLISRLASLLLIQDLSSIQHRPAVKFEMDFPLPGEYGRGEKPPQAKQFVVARAFQLLCSLLADPKTGMFFWPTLEIRYQTEFGSPFPYVTFVENVMIPLVERRTHPAIYGGFFHIFNSMCRLFHREPDRVETLLQIPLLDSVLTLLKSLYMERLDREAGATGAHVEWVPKDGRVVGEIMRFLTIASGVEGGDADLVITTRKKSSSPWFLDCIVFFARFRNEEVLSSLDQSGGGYVPYIQSQRAASLLATLAMGVNDENAEYLYTHCGEEIRTWIRPDVFPVLSPTKQTQVLKIIGGLQRSETLRPRVGRDIIVHLLDITAYIFEVIAADFLQEIRDRKPSEIRITEGRNDPHKEVATLLRHLPMAYLFLAEDVNPQWMYTQLFIACGRTMKNSIFGYCVLAFLSSQLRVSVNFSFFLEHIIPKQLEICRAYFGCVPHDPKKPLMVKQGELEAGEEPEPQLQPQPRPKSQPQPEAQAKGEEEGEVVQVQKKPPGAEAEAASEGGSDGVGDADGKVESEGEGEVAQVDEKDDDDDRAVQKSPGAEAVPPSTPQTGPAVEPTAEPTAGAEPEPEGEEGEGEREAGTVEGEAKGEEPKAQVPDKDPEADADAVPVPVPVADVDADADAVADPVPDQPAQSQAGTADVGTADVGTAGPATAREEEGEVAAPASGEMESSGQIPPAAAATADPVQPRRVQPGFIIGGRAYLEHAHHFLKILGRSTKVTQERKRKFYALKQVLDHDLLDNYPFLIPLAIVSGDQVVPADEITVQCRVCGGNKGVRRCCRCKVAFYCSSACQEKDWKEHRVDCRQRFAVPLHSI